MRLILKYLLALLASAIFTTLTMLFVGVVNFVFVGEIPVNLTIIATFITFLLYSFVTCLIAYLTTPSNDNKIVLPNRNSNNN